MEEQGPLVQLKETSAAFAFRKDHFGKYGWRKRSMQRPWDCVVICTQEAGWLEHMSEGGAGSCEAVCDWGGSYYVGDWGLGIGTGDCGT